MPFFLPRRLIDLEYTKTGEVDKEYSNLIDRYSDDVDFAFFVVNFGYSRSDYEELTPRDMHFIRKAYENKTVKETTEMRNAVLNAVNNAFRKKNQRFMKLWERVSRPIDKEKAKNDVISINQIEKAEGKSWVDLIYAVNGMKRPMEVNHG